MNEPDKIHFKTLIDEKLKTRQLLLQNNSLQNKKKTEKKRIKTVCETGVDPTFFVFTKSELDSHLYKF